MAKSAKSRAGLLVAAVPVAGVICLAGSFAWAIWQTYQERVDPGPIALACLGILLFLSIFVRAELANLKHYLNVSIYSLFVLGICVVLYLLAQSHNPEFDLTSHRKHTLSEATRQYLGLLKKDVEIVVLDVAHQPYEGLLNRIAAITPRVRWSLHDPRREPEIELRFNATVALETIYIVHGDKQKRISLGELSESAITNAIVEVTREQRIKIYFLTGHNELAFAAPPPNARSNDPSLSIFKDFLAERVMEVEQLDLTQRGFVPRDATLVVVAGPKRDLYEAEERLLERYLSEGGKMLVMFDPPSTTRGADFTYLARLIRRRGIDDQDMVVVDSEGDRLLGNFLRVPVQWYNDRHVITKSLSRNAAAIDLPQVRALGRIEPPPRGIVVTPLIRSSPEAWAESFGEIYADPAKVAVHPPDEEDFRAQDLGWAVEGAAGVQSGMRLAVFGTSILVRNGYVESRQTAAVLMLSTVNWLVEQEDLVAIPPRIIAGTPMILSAAQLRRLGILILLALPVPLFFGGVGYTLLIRRS